MVGQAIAVLPIVMSGCQLRFVELGGYGFDLGMLGIPATIFWLVLGINSLNLLDGMDGMASVVSTSIALTLAAVCSINGQQPYAVLIFPLAGSLLGFLAYNFPPARIYMGDAGSMVLGLALSLASLLAAQADGPVANLTMLSGIMMIPLADTALAIIRRSLSGFGFWHPDRAHIHHRLLDQGLPARQVLTIFASLAAAWGVVVVTAAAWRVEWPIWCGLAVAGIFSVQFHVAGQHEWTMLTRWIGKWRLVNFALPTQAQLLAMPSDAVWQSLLWRMRGLPIVSVTLAVEDATGTTAERGWSDPAAADPRSALEVQIRSLANHRCRLRIEANDLPVGAAWSRLPQLLDCFAQFWADHPETVEVAVLTFDGNESLSHWSSAKRPLRRAKTGRLSGLAGQRREQHGRLSDPVKMDR